MSNLSAFLIIIYHTDSVMPRLTKSSSLVLTFRLFILFRDKVMFRSYPRSKASNIYKDFYVRRFWPRLRLVTLAEKHAFSIYLTTSSDILFRTSFKLRSLFVF